MWELRSPLPLHTIPTDQSVSQKPLFKEALIG